MPRTRKTATRSAEPQSPARQRSVVSNASSPNELPSVRDVLRPSGKRRHDDGHKLAKTPATAREVARPLKPVVEEEEVATTEKPTGHRLHQSPNANGPEDFASSNSWSAPSVSGGSDDDDDDDEQLAELDRDLIIESLPALYQDASKVLSFFEPKNISQSLEAIKGTKSKLFKMFHRRLVDTLTAFRHAPNLIRPRLLLRKLTGSSNVVDAPWRPDAVFYLANLAVMISDVVVDDNDAALEMLANSFPETYFLDSFRASDRKESPVDTTWRNLTIDIAIAIRTQFFVRAVGKYKDLNALDPDNLLHQAFFDEDDNLLGLDATHDAWAETMRNRVWSRIEEIQTVFATSKNNRLSLSILRDALPWSDFVRDLTSWALLRSNELEISITKSGGAEQITDSIRSKDFTSPTNTSRPLAGVTSTPAHTDAMSGAQPSRQSMSSRLTRLKEIRRRQDAEVTDESSDTTSQAEQNKSHEIRESPVLGQIVEENEEIEGSFASEDEVKSEVADGSRDATPPRGTQVSIKPTQQTALILQASQRQIAQSNKENINSRAKVSIPPVPSQSDKTSNKRRYVDGQKGATRVQWDEEHDDEDFETDRRAQKRPKTREHTYQYDLVDEDDEDEEEVVERLIRNARDRIPRPQTTPRAQSSHPPAPSRSPLQARPHAKNPRTSRAPSSTAPARGPSGELDLDEESLPPSTQLELINQQAKVNVRRHVAVLERLPPPQIRRAWTSDEVNRLADLIAKYGCKWSLMLKEDSDHPDGPMLQGRTQVNIKDKARNIKLDLLKANQPLLPGFSTVSIKTSDKIALRRLGIPYDGDED